MPDYTVIVQRTSDPFAPAAAQEAPPEDHELYVTRLALRLLVILCLGALASFSLASAFLPSSLHTHSTTRSGYTHSVNMVQPQTSHASPLLFPGAIEKA